MTTTATKPTTPTTTATTPTTTNYLLGSDGAELARLELQARVLDAATRAIFGQAGLAPGMRVLDLGTGIGDVAFTAAELVGEAGAVVGVDQSADALAVAEQRRRARGLHHVRFVQGRVGEWTPNDSFDAVIGRLILLYCPDPAATLAHHCAHVRPGGLVVAMEYDMTVIGSVPDVPLVATVRRWLLDTFSRTGHDVTLGVRLPGLLRRAGLAEPSTMAGVAYVPPEEEGGAALLAGVLRSMLPAIERTGVATAAEVDIETLGPRLAEELRRTPAVFRYASLVGAWARTPRR